MKHWFKLPGEHGSAFVCAEDVKAIIDMPGVKCCLLIDARQVIIRAPATQVSEALRGAAVSFDVRTKPNQEEVPGEEGKILDQVDGVTG